MKKHEFVFTAVLVASCADNNEYSSLTVRGEGFGNGQAHICVTNIDADEVVACESTTVHEGVFELQLDKIMQPMVVHRVNAFVDLDENQRCEFGSDAVMTTEVREATTVTFANEDTWIGDDPSGCVSFGGVSFQVSVSGLTKSWLRYALIRMNTDGTTIDKVITVDNAPIAQGQALIDLPGAGQQGRFYQIAFFEADTPDAPCNDSVFYRHAFGASGEDDPFTCGVSGGSTTFLGDITKPSDFDTGLCSDFTPTT
ncbi:MAG: hypothetical protein MUC50_16905 [Myxococcota bacterium]|jgi:hypothetical protein|nr:hypothetical protein [Myxococcota bacterium]